MAILESPTSSELGLFLVQVVIVLCVVRVLGTLLRRLKQPMVIGEILAGVLDDSETKNHILKFNTRNQLFT